MNYKEALKYILQIPMFQNSGKSAYNPSLDKIYKLCKMVDNPQNSFTSIHVAGTNGKGSTSSLMQSAFISAGYKTALYTSPHLTNFRERATINNQMISEEYIAEFIGKNIEMLRVESPSFFELTTLLAFSWFAAEGVDIAIIETGLGGRLDATNVINPTLSIITNISRDHIDILGGTLDKIAIEKSGIIKRGIPIVIGEVKESSKIFIEKAEELNSPIFFAPKEYIFKDETPFGNIRKITFIHNNTSEIISTNLMGLYQIENVASALTALDIINKQGRFTITKEQIIKGFTTTTLKGRWQTLATSPLTICDTGHNQAGVEFIVKQLKKCNFNTLYIVLGVVADKDINTILSLLPKEAYYIFTKSKVARALNEKELEEIAATYNLKGESAPTVELALERAKKMASPSDMIFIGGSTFTVAEIG